MHPRPHLRREDGIELPYQTWSFPEPRLTASTASVGGGLGPRRWILNATVDLAYRRTDIDRHIAELAADAALDGPGVGLLTAVDVRGHRVAELDGVAAVATVGVTDTLRADGDLPRPDPGIDPIPAGTINIVVFLPVRLAEGALLNAIATATEAKVAALADRGHAATGTPTDSVTICCPLTGEPEIFAGPGSPWGARIARLVHGVVASGIDGQRRSLRPDVSS